MLTQQIEKQSLDLSQEVYHDHDSGFQSENGWLRSCLAVNTAMFPLRLIGHGWIDLFVRQCHEQKHDI